MSMVHSAETQAQAQAYVDSCIAQGIPAGNVRLTGYQTTTGSYDTPKEEQYPVTRLEWAYETHIGLCLYETEHNGSWDSDFYMVWWHPVEKTIHSTQFATTRFGCTVQFGSRPDATLEVMAEYEAWRAVQREEQRKAAAEREAKEPRKGKTLKVVRGRKVPIGTVGECFWRGETPFGERVGLRTEDGTKYFTAITNVEVTAP